MLRFKEIQHAGNILQSQTTTGESEAVIVDGPRMQPII